VKRREFITLLGGAAAWPLSVNAQQPTIPVVGFLSSLSASVTGKRVVSLGQGLTETGYVVGRDVMVEQRLADGQYDRLPALPSPWRPVRGALFIMSTVKRWRRF
jgi:putative tryptophan/tyrosine transport system substrate-binding protein